MMKGKFDAFLQVSGLGNDYLVIEPSEAGQGMTVDRVRLICHRNYGIGSEPFTIMTAGGKVRSQVHDSGRSVTVDMGRVSFDSSRIPVLGPPRKVLNEAITVNGEDYRFCAATVGNPHCVILCDNVSSDEAKQVGPLVENDPRFPNRTNVQFLRVLDRANIRIEIWERGAGYTLASGSSSCAAAAVAHKLGLCDAEITVHMPGGQISVSITEDFAITMTGPVIKVCEGTISDDLTSLTR